MATISVSSLFMVGQRVAKYCRATLAFGSLSLRTGGSLLSSAFRSLMTVVEVDYGRIASSLRDARPSPGLASCLAFNILLITGVAALCISGYGFAPGLSIVVLALAPTLMLLNIGLFAWIEEEQRPRPLRAISTSTQALQRSETLDEKNPSIVPETSATGFDEKVRPERETAKAKPQID